MRKGIEVRILGQVFNVASDDGEEHVRRVAAEVDRRMRELAGSGQPAFTAAVVAALNIASDYQKLQDKHRNVQENIDRLTARLTARLGPARSGGKENHESERTGDATPREGG